MVSAGAVDETNKRRSPDGATVATGHDGLCVSIAPKRNWWDRIFLSAWMFAWAIGEIGVVTVLLGKERITADDAFPVIWLVTWTVVGYFTGSRWLFIFWGREQLIVGQTSITLRTTVLGQLRSQEFDLQLVRHVRSVYRGTIAFDYRGKTYRFGRTLSAATCQILENAIEQSRNRQGEAGSTAAPSAGT